MGTLKKTSPTRPRAAGLADALFSTTQQRVLGFLFGQPRRSFYATELIALAGAGSGAVQRELEWLERSGLVTVSRIGARKHYQANRDSVLFDELCSIARKVLPAGEVTGTGTLRVPRQRVAALCRRYGIRKLSLFGSAARNELAPGSDVDLLVEFDPESKTTLFDLPGMQEAFSPLFGHRRIDLATPEILENPFRRRAIEPDLKVLYAA